MKAAKGRLLDLRDRVAVLDGVEDFDSDSGNAAAEILATHNALIIDDLFPPDDAA